MELLEQAKSIVEECKDEEQEYLDNMPESFRNGDKGSTAESNASELESAECSVDEAVDDLSSICDKIDAAISSVEGGQE